MVTVVARYVAGEGHESTVTRLLRQNAEASRAEPGCLEFSVCQGLDEPREILLYKRYTDEDAFQAHRRTPHFHDIIERRVVLRLDPQGTANHLTLSGDEAVEGLGSWLASVQSRA